MNCPVNPRRENQGCRDIHEPVLLSMVVLMRNEESFVAKCLDSILAQIQGRSDVEVFCVDGLSTDRTREIIHQYAAVDSRIRPLDNPSKIVPTGMNLALAQARGQVIMILGCHALYAVDYIEQCLAVLQRTGADMVGGYMTTLPGKCTPTGLAIAAATSSPFGVGGSTFRTRGKLTEREVDTVPFGCFRRAILDRVGLFDERLVRNQDMEFSSRIRRHGGRILISPSIRLTYFNRSTFAGIRQQSWYNGLWNAYTVCLVRGGLRLRHFVPLAFVLFLILPALAGLVWRPAWLLLAVIAGVYLVTGSVMAIRAALTPLPAGDATAPNEGRSVEWPLPHLILATFIQMHLWYGVGSLCGFLSAPLRFGLRPTRHPGKAIDAHRK